MSRPAVILAAGLGSRLASSDGPKPLTPVGGVPVLHRTISGWLEAGASEVVVVVGHRDVDIRASVHTAFRADRVRCVENPNFRGGNGLSVLVGADAVSSPFALSMADHILERRVFSAAMDAVVDPEEAVLFVDPDPSGVFDLDDATRVRTDGDRIVAIGKELRPFDAVDIGVFVASVSLVRALRDVAQRTGDASLSDGVAALSSRGGMRAARLHGVHWQDVDDTAMLGEAERLIAAHPALFPSPHPSPSPGSP